MISTIDSECSEFLLQSDGLPMIKALPIHADGFRKVKVRHKKSSDPIDLIFNEQFSIHENVLTRSIFVNGTNAVADTSNDELFYVFPINGFKFTYNPQVIDYSQDYRVVLEKLVNSLPYENGHAILKDILSAQYIHTDLHSALLSECEIIVYGVSHYYAIRKSLICDYDEFFHSNSLNNFNN